MDSIIHQMLRIVSYVKRSFPRDPVSPFPIRPDENIVYLFDSGHVRCVSDEQAVSSTEEWFERLREKHLNKIFMHIHTPVNNPQMAGYANAEAEGIFTVFEGGMVSVWIPRASYDNARENWTSTFSETNWPFSQNDLPVYSDPTEDFKSILIRIGQFALEIGYDHYASVFRKSYALLTGEETPVIPDWMPDRSMLPTEDDWRLLLAANNADVFGGMGSWNDSPPWVAHDLGREDEYHQLSHELYVQIRRMYLYAINHW